jgi:creatinine amidohydrolase
MLFEQLKWRDLKNLSSKVFVVPLGSLEQHGPHLPLGTDSWIAGEIAKRVEHELADDVVLLPVLWLGHSPHHQHFGCASVDMRPYMDMLGGLCRSLAGSGARKVLLLNGHGGNEAPAKAALREVKDHLRSIPDLYIAFASYWNLAALKLKELRESPAGGMGHACELETSILLDLAPQAVDTSAIAPDGLKAESKFLQHDMLAAQPYFLVNDFHEITRSGVFGMPQYASAEKGKRFLDVTVQSVLEFIRDFQTWTYQEEIGKV